jgi:hypothetical protein
MSQAHGEATYKLTSPNCKWVWAGYVEQGAVAGAHRPQLSDLTPKNMSPDSLSTCEQYGAPPSKCDHRSRAKKEVL